MALTRRLFGLSLAGISTAWGSTAGFVKHAVLRRPYRHVEQIPSRRLMLLDCLHLQVACSAPLRVTVTQSGMSEPILLATLTPKDGAIFRLLGVHGFRANDTTVAIDSREPFRLLYISAVYMHPPFRREDGMINYLNPAFPSHPDHAGFGRVYHPHHRKIGGGGSDIAY